MSDIGLSLSLCTKLARTELFQSPFFAGMELHRLSFSSTASERRRRKNKLWYGLGAALVIVVLLTAGLAIGLGGRNRDTPQSTIAPTSVPTLNPTCLELDDLQRFDCHPDSLVSEERCLYRGCCYKPASDLNVTDEDLINSRYMGIPSCYFPDNYKGYKVKESKSTGNSITARLERARPSGFSRDVEFLRLEVTAIDEYKLRIKIRDANADRFEPEVPVFYKVKPDADDLYACNLSSDGTLQVIRSSTNTTVFRTELSRLIFSDLFLQLSTEIPSKYIYGLGEQKETILKSTNWARYTLFNQGDLPVPNRNLYGSHPFYLVMEPDGYASGVFLLNSNAMDYVLQPTPAVTIRTVGGIFDFFLFLGPTPGDVVSQYTQLFGAPNFPPRWSLGFHLCRYGYDSLNKTAEVLNRNLEAGVRVDVQWNDIDFMERHLDFTYNSENFTELPQFIEELHTNGRHYVAMISPGLSNAEPEGTYPAYDEAKKLDLFIKDASGEYIQGQVWNTNYTVYADFSHPNTSSYWKRQFEAFYKKLKFDGVWIDMNEPLNFLNGSTEGCSVNEYDNAQYVPGRPYPLHTLTLCMSAKHYKTLHYNEHNLLAYREAKATHSAMSSITGKRPFIISRASFAGQGVYSGHWSGDITSDWDDMRYSIPAMLAFSLFGMPMTGSDICGFRTSTSPELCTRWQSLGSFYPFSRNHNDFDTIEQDPAEMGGTVLEATKKALEIRYYLIPYLYTLFYRYHAAGETVARPLFFEFPDDTKTYTIEDEFLWGPGLLIMPALHEGVKNITPYIPKGYWYSLDGLLRKSKGEKFTLPANLTDINVALRGGYILPAQKPGNTTTDSALNPFDLLVALDEDGKAKGELFWDDGETLGTYENEKYNLIKMEVKEKNLHIWNSKKGYGAASMKLNQVKIYGLTKKPTTVVLNKGTVSFEFKSDILYVDATGHSLLDVINITWSG